MLFSIHMLLNSIDWENTNASIYGLIGPVLS